jgi:hypothetical protein
MGEETYEQGYPQKLGRGFCEIFLDLSILFFTRSQLSSINNARSGIRRGPAFQPQGKSRSAQVDRLEARQDLIASEETQLLAFDTVGRDGT